MIRDARTRGPGLAALGLVLALAVGCGTAEAGPTTDTGPVRGGTVTFATDREPTCLDPHNSGDMPQAYIARQYLDSLVSQVDGGRVVPWLAQSWTISPDGRTYDFTLKPGVRFTDGTPLNAAAVVANFTHILDPATQSSTSLLYLKPYYERAWAVSDRVVRLQLTRPYSPLLTVLAQAFFGIQSPAAMARGLEANCESPVGTGPFEIVRWNHGRDVELVRNEGHNSQPADARHQGPAHLDRIVWRFLKDNTTRYGALASGEVDAIFNVPPESEEIARANPDITLQTFVHSGAPFGLELNTTSPVFSDIRVRQAFLYASSARAAVHSAYAGVFPYEGNAISSGTPAYDPARHEPYPFRPDEANRLLDAAGWTGRDADGYRTRDGATLAVRLPYNGDDAETPPADVTLLQNVQAMQKRVGIRVDLRPVASSAMNAIYGDRTAYDAIGSYWNSPTPAVLYIKYSRATLETSTGQNAVFAADRTLDDTLLAAAATTDPARQRALYAEAQRIVAAKAWALPLYPIQTRLAVSNRLRDVWIEPSEGEPVLADAYLIGGGR